MSFGDDRRREVKWQNSNDTGERQAGFAPAGIHAGFDGSLIRLKRRAVTIAVKPLPLTLALSLREREQQHPFSGNSNYVGFADRRATILPLPEGEGRGEGKGTWPYVARPRRIGCATMMTICVNDSENLMTGAGVFG
ncbi:MAG: hypothetical protein DME26_20175 [Verrucomicrobia bacterium]|nr:MAG: hypothetical protein DME26_20175 [Verrucomicrobiota bacterium]